MASAAKEGRQGQHSPALPPTCNEMGQKKWRGAPASAACVSRSRSTQGAAHRDTSGRRAPGAGRHLGAGTCWWSAGRNAAKPEDAATHAKVCLSACIPPSQDVMLTCRSPQRVLLGGCCTSRAQAAPCRQAAATHCLDCPLLLLGTQCRRSGRLVTHLCQPQPHQLGVAIGAAQQVSIQLAVALGDGRGGGGDGGGC